MSYPAESYENYMVAALFAPWSAHLIRSANVQPGEHVLDVACGTGIVARYSIRRRLVHLEAPPNNGMNPTCDERSEAQAGYA